MTGVTPIYFLFNKVLPKLQYAHHLDHDSYLPPVQVEAKSTIGDYFREMTYGVRYEHFVHSEQNRANPHRLTSENFSNTKNVGSQGWKYETISALIDYEWDQLEEIPLDADLFKTNEFDEPIIEVLNVLCNTSGIQPANATKLLYQKRSSLVPILDSYAREVMGIGWIHDNQQFFSYAFERLRSLAANRRSQLDLLEEWITENPSVTSGLKLSRIRIIDILAWSVKKTPGVALQ